MTCFVIDLVGDGRPVTPGNQLVAPNSVRLQAMELLLQAVNQAQMSGRDAMELHERAWDLAREHGSESLREAEYLAITQLQADALVTRDLTLIRLGTGIVVFADLEAIFSGRQEPAPDR